MDLWTGPLARACRLSAKRAHLWMAGWTTLRVAHAPTHRPSAAHKLHRALPPRIELSKKKTQSPLTLEGITPQFTSTTEALHQTTSTSAIQSNPRNPATDPNRSRCRNHRSRSPKYARDEAIRIATTHGQHTMTAIAAHLGLSVSRVCRVFQLLEDNQATEEGGPSRLRTTP